MRGYNEPDGFAKKLPFELVSNVVSTGSDSAYMFGAKGVRFDRETRINVAKACQAIGKNWIVMERHGERHVIDVAKLLRR